MSMLKKILLSVIACVVLATVVGHNGYADNKYNLEALGAVIVQLEQKAAQQDKQIKDLLEKTNDEQNTINAIKKNVQSLVRVTSDKEIGSGFYVKPNLILTAYHVVEGSSINVNIDTYDHKSIKGVVINHDSKHDIAMIEVEELGVPVTINTDIHIGQTAISYGYPMGIDATANKGIISSIGDDLQTSTPINNGDSGGMLLDSNGDVIGLVKSRLSSVPNGDDRADVYLVGYATKPGDLMLFMRRFK
jgi:serine protease Do